MVVLRELSVWAWRHWAEPPSEFQWSKCIGSVAIKTCLLNHDGLHFYLLMTFLNDLLIPEEV